MSFFNKKNNKFGFTLIELIIVVAILATLIAVIAPKLGAYIESAKKTAVLANARAFHVSCIAGVTEILTINNMPLTPKNIAFYREKYLDSEELIEKGYYALHKNQIVSTFIRQEGYVAVYPEAIYVDNATNDFMPDKPKITIDNQEFILNWVQII